MHTEAYSTGVAVKVEGTARSFEAPIVKSGNRMRPEIGLLLACARARTDPAAGKRITALVRQNLDWDYVILKARQQCVLPLLYWGLHAAARDAVPEDIFNRIHLQFMSHVQKNLSLTRELIRLLQILDTEGIEAIPLKGPVLAASVYGDVAMRFYCDLDILVREEDVVEAKRVLISEGYRIEAGFEDTETTVKFLSRKKAYRFASEAANTVIELHWRVTGKNFYFSPDIGSLWERHEKVPLAGSIVRNLSPEDLLLYLCVHGAKHYFGRLEWICDIGELVRARPDLNWDRVFQQARLLGSQRMLLLGLFLSHDLLGTTLPVATMEKVTNDPRLRSLAAGVCETLFSSDVRPGFIKSNSYRMKVRERLWDRVRLGLRYYPLIVRVAVTPNKQDRAFLHLPRSLSFVYYFIRPIRLAKEYGIKPFRSLKQ